MRGLHIAALCAAALLHPIQDSSATSVFRCEDSNGQITFTRHGCAPEQTQYRQEVRNHSPGSGKPIPLAVPRARTATPTTRSRAPVIVGEQDDVRGLEVWHREGVPGRDRGIPEEPGRRGLWPGEVCQSGAKRKRAVFGDCDRFSQTLWH